MKRKDWALVSFSLYNPLFSEILDHECTLFNLLEKLSISYSKAHMYPAAISLLLRRWSACYLTEPFTRHEVAMQENFLH